MNRNSMLNLSYLLKSVRIFGHEDIPEEDSSVSSDYDDSDFSLQTKQDPHSPLKSSCNKPIPIASDCSTYQSSLYNNGSEISRSLDSSCYSSTPVMSENYSSYGCESVYDKDLNLGNEYDRGTQPDFETDIPEHREISLNEVAQHDMLHDCWIVLYDKVYDITDFLYEHPGGEELLMEHAGRDATIAFRGVGHSKAAVASLKQYLVGVLPEIEKIFSSWEVL